LTSSSEIQFKHWIHFYIHKERVNVRAKQKSLWLILMLFLIPVTVSLAAEGFDDQGNPNDPNVNERANACYDGSTMAGKCDSEWAWGCGWYMIRYDAGFYSRDEVPATCASLLPPQVEGQTTTVTWPPAGCYYSAVYNLYIIWNGNQTQSTIDLTWDGTCATPPHTGVGGFLLVSTPDVASAAALCATYGYNYIDEVSSASDTGAWAIYRCQIP
jgi:hypothetical protein